MSREPITRQRAFELVVERLEALIAENPLESGARLPPERELSQRFGVSRVVVREAMRFLESRGIVEVKQGSGAFVGSSTKRIATTMTLPLMLERASLIELFIARQALELATAALAAQQATPKAIETLSTLLENLGELNSIAPSGLAGYRTFAELDVQFHLGIAEASGNGALSTLLRAVLPLLNSGRLELLKRRRADMEAFLTPERLNTVLDEHKSIFAAIKNRDPVGARNFMDWQLQRSIEAWRTMGELDLAVEGKGEYRPHDA